MNNFIIILSKIIHTGDFVRSKSVKFFIEDWFLLLERNFIIAAIFAIWIRTDIILFGVIGAVSLSFLLIYSSDMPSRLLSNIVSETDEINNNYKKLFIPLIKTNTKTIVIFAVTLTLIMSIVLQYLFFLAFSSFFDFI